VFPRWEGPELSSGTAAASRLLNDEDIYNDSVAIVILNEAVVSMPIFEYVCQECDHQFEAIVQGSKKARCPKCESKKLEQQISRFGVSGEKAAAFSAGASAGGCGT
jgi:putative FmdB family regulatory protein